MPYSRMGQNMSHHVWGDPWFIKHGEELNSAIYEIMKTWRRYGRIGSHGKEKWGRFQDAVYFYHASWPIHELVKPGYVWYQWPRRWMLREIKFSKLVRCLKLPVLIRAYQEVIYNAAIQRACLKYPHLIDELVADLDYPELIKPGIFGKIDGQKIHSKYWSTSPLTFPISMDK